MSDRLRWEGVPDIAVATSKTFKQLARLAGAPAQCKGPFVCRSVTTADLDVWIPRLAGRTAQQRAELRGISAARARQIVAGAVVARATMKALDVSHVDVCPWALREGVILRYLQTTMDSAQCMPLRPVRRRTGDDQAPVRVLASAP